MLLNFTNYAQEQELLDYYAIYIQVCINNSLQVADNFIKTVLLNVFMHRLKYTIMLHYKMTVLLKHIDCALFYLLYIFPIMLALYLLPSITGTHYTQTYVDIIGGSLFVEVLDHSAAMLCYACIIM